MTTTIPEWESLGDKFLTSGDERSGQHATNLGRKGHRMPCRDIGGRRRDVVVFGEAGRVFLTAPPGEAAVFAPLDVCPLCAVLRDAAIDPEPEH